MFGVTSDVEKCTPCDNLYVCFDVYLYDEGSDGKPGNILKIYKDQMVPALKNTFTIIQLPVKGVTISSRGLFVEVRWGECCCFSQLFKLSASSQNSISGNDFMRSVTGNWLPMPHDSSIDLGIVIVGFKPLAPGNKDSINNVEGIEIPNPEIGRYQLKVIGAEVNYGPQDYAVVVSGGVASIVANYPFDTSDNGWTFSGQICRNTTSCFDIPSIYSLPGNIALSASGSTNSFGYITSPEIIVENGRDYQATFIVRSTIADSNLVPQFRMRVNQDSTKLAWTMGVNSYDNVSPTWNSPKAYHIYFTPQMLNPADKVTLSFDLISFDPKDDTGAWLCLEEATVSLLK